MNPQPASPAPAPPVRLRPPALPNNDLERPLALARHLIAGVEAFAAALLPAHANGAYAGPTLSLSLGLLDEIELPPIVRSEADVAQIQSLAPLYLAAELEAARLLPAVELLAALFVSGGLQVEDKEAGAALYAFWQRRNERFSQDERRAIFARLFGGEDSAASPGAALPAYRGQGGANHEFDLLLLALANALLQAEVAPIWPPGRPPAVPAGVSLAAILAAAEALISNLLPRSGGITAFAAREITASISEALAVLKNRAVQAALGVSSLWPAVQAALARYKQEQVRVTPHIQRGKSGMVLLTWLAEIAPYVSASATAGGAPSLPPPPVFAAATAWLQASADLQGRPF